MDEKTRIKITDYDQYSKKKSFYSTGKDAKVLGSVSKYSNTATEDRVFARWNDFYQDIKARKLDKSLLKKIEYFVVTFQNFISHTRFDSSVYLVPIKFSLDEDSIFCEWIFPQIRFGFNFSLDENTWTVVKSENANNFIFKSETFDLEDLPKILIQSISLI